MLECNESSITLYQALSTYQILECIEHRYLNVQDQKCILIVGDYIKERFPHYKNLEEFFDEVYLFRFGGYSGSIDDILKSIEDELKRTLPYDLSKVSHKYIAGIHTYLQVYMLENNIEFDMFEDGSGALSRPWILANITKKESLNKYKTIEAYKLYTHESTLIKEKYCDMEAQLPGFYDEKAVNFNVYDNYLKLRDDIQNKILSFFGIDKKILIEENTALVLTQQFSNLGQLTFEDQILIYQELVDYYLDDESIIIKPHPDDIMYYDMLFPEAKIVKIKFPSELIPFAFSSMPSKLVTITSTGVNLIRKSFKEVINFNELYERTFKYNYIYFAVVEFLDSLKIRNITTVGANDVQLYNLIHKWLLRDVKMLSYDEILGDTVVLCDDFKENDGMIDNLLLDYENGIINTVIFLNSSDEYSFYKIGQAWIWDEMIPLIIHKKCICSFEHYDNEVDHVVYVLTKKDTIKNKARSFRMNTQLKHVGSEISVDEERISDYKIKMLEGRLAATEKRLLSYIENEKKLLEKIRNYEGNK